MRYEIRKIGAIRADDGQGWEDNGSTRVGEADVDISLSPSQARRRVLFELRRLGVIGAGHSRKLAVRWEDGDNLCFVREKRTDRPLFFLCVCE